MVQVINKDDRSSMLGRAVGGALSDTIPKEVERYRLSKGLNDLANNQDSLSPFQQYAKLAAIPGVTPSIIEGASQLLKNQATRNAYQNAAGGAGVAGSAGAGPSQEVQNQSKAANLGTQVANNIGENVRNPGSIQDNISASGDGQVVTNNPTRPTAEPRRRWNQAQYEAERLGVANQFPYATPQEIERMTAEKEERYLAGPDAEQKIDAYQKQVREDIQKELDRQLQKKLQKTPEGTFSDASGELQEEVKRLVERDVKKDPNLTINDAVNQRTNQILDFAKSKSNLNKLANRSILSKLTPGKGAEVYDDLKQIQNSYDKLNRNEEMFLEIQRPEGLNLSRRGAASVAYPIKKVEGLSDYVKKSKNSNMGNREVEAIKHAINIEPFLSNAKASPLAIAKAFKDKDPNFDDRAFIRQIREDLDAKQLLLHPEQERQLEDTALDVFPNWGDIFTLPLIRGL